MTVLGEMFSNAEKKVTILFEDQRAVKCQVSDSQNRHSSGVAWEAFAAVVHKECSPYAGVQS